MSDTETTASEPLSQRAKAMALRQAHRDDELLVMLNVWDVASARTVASVPGCRAVATASAAVAAAHGFADGEQIDRSLMLAVIGRICSGVPVPVSADLERGYGDDPQAVAETLSLAVEAGAVGANLEDSVPRDEQVVLRPVAEQEERIAAARSAADAGIPLVLNARTDVYLHPGAAVDELLVDAAGRGRAYLDAGADCVFVPGLKDLATIKTLCQEFDGRLSLLVDESSPSLQHLEAAGVARVSFGPGTMRLAYGALREGAGRILTGELPAGLSPAATDR